MCSTSSANASRPCRPPPWYWPPAAQTTSLPIPSSLPGHSPTTEARCRGLGIDISEQPIAVVPAAHYACGGVVTDLRGRTDLARLYAVGEPACTGLDGANRLASNSLLECVVIGQS